MIDSILRGSGIAGAVISTVKNIYNDIHEARGKRF